MTLPYENATSGERALGEIQKILRGFGCNKFGSMVDDGTQEVIVQFEHRGRQVSVQASMRGYAAACQSRAGFFGSHPERARRWWRFRRGGSFLAVSVAYRARTNRAVVVCDP